MLASPPKHYLKRAYTTPYRLLNGIVPLNDQSVAFINHLVAGNCMFIAEVQAMWVVALFDGNVTLPNTHNREREVAEWCNYSKRRYLSNGIMGNFAAFDVIPYTDKLMREMGLKSWWKGWGKDAWGVNRPSDLGRAWREYLGRNRTDMS